MNKPLRLTLFLLLLLACGARAQTKVNTDSLWKVYHTTSNTQVRMKALMNIARTLRPNYPDSTLQLLDTLEPMAQESRDTMMMASIQHLRGIVYKNKAHYKLALKHYLLALNGWEQVGYDTGVASVHQHLGNVYTRISDLPKAELHYNMAVDGYRKIADEEGLAGVYSDMGNTYRTFHQDSLAMVLLRKSLEIRVRYKDARGIATTQTNMAGVFAQIGQTDSALFYLQLFYEYALSKNNTPNMIRGLSNIGEMHNLNGDFARGRDSCMKAFVLNSTFNSLQDRKNTCECLFNSYKGLKRYDSAVKYLELFREVNDSLVKESTSDEIARLEIEYEYNQRAVQDSLQTAQQLEILNAQSEGEKKLRYALFAGLGLTVIFGGVMFNRFRVTRRQKNLIAEQNLRTEEQKRQIEEKNREITDSINYAQRIQSAILPSETELKKSFADIFVLFKPRDIVSGDFYWYDESTSNKVIAVADCTGHGVPGGFMSMLGYEILQDVVMLEEIKTTSAALARLDHKVTTALNKNDKSYRDGMDMALCSFSKSRNTVQFSGANRGMIHVSGGRLTQYKPDKHTIGGAIDGTEKQFTHVDVELKSGDMIFLFSDGYADQFGGPQGKKFMSKKLEELLLSIASKNCGEQKTALEASFTGWKGSLEQVDDVCVIGIRI